MMRAFCGQQTEKDAVTNWYKISLLSNFHQPSGLGADTGIDRLKSFRDLDKKEVREIVVSVKGGGIKAEDVRALIRISPARAERGAVWSGIGGGNGRASFATIDACRNETAGLRFPVFCANIRGSPDDE